MSIDFQQKISNSGFGRICPAATKSVSIESTHFFGALANFLPEGIFISRIAKGNDQPYPDFFRNDQDFFDGSLVKPAEHTASEAKFSGLQAEMFSGNTNIDEWKFTVFEPSTYLRDHIRPFNSQYSQNRGLRGKFIERDEFTEGRPGYVRFYVGIGNEYQPPGL